MRRVSVVEGFSVECDSVEDGVVEDSFEDIGGAGVGI